MPGRSFSVVASGGRCRSVSQTRAVIETRAQPLGIEVVEATLLPDLPRRGLPEGDFFGVILQVPGASGRIVDAAPIIARPTIVVRWWPWARICWH